jgi:hypothetical protein
MCPSETNVASLKNSTFRVAADSGLLLWLPVEPAEETPVRGEQSRRVYEGNQTHCQQDRKKELKEILVREVRVRASETIPASVYPKNEEDHSSRCPEEEPGFMAAL